MPVSKYIHSAAYRVGECRFHIYDIDGYESRLRQMKIPAAAGIGLGYFWVTSDIYQLVQDSVATTIALSGAPSKVIDQVIVCSSHFSDPFDYRNRRLAAALVNNEISPEGTQGVCGAGCADVLRGIEIACQMLDLQTANNVLIIGMEALAAGELSARLRDYALISDAAVSFVISNSSGASDQAGTLQIVARKNITMLAKVGPGMNIRDAKDYARSTAAVLEAAALRAANVTRIFGNNTYWPVKIYRESSAGFSKQQMYFDNVERLGHCLACDSILNLIDFDTGRQEGHYVLSAEAEGHASAILLKR